MTTIYSVAIQTLNATTGRFENLTETATVTCYNFATKASLGAGTWENITTGVYKAYISTTDGLDVLFAVAVAVADQANFADVLALHERAITDAILEDTGTTIPALLGSLGGALTLTYTVYKSGGGVLEGATVKLYSDSARTTLVNTKISDVLGQVVFTNLVAGTYYLTTTVSGYEDMLDSEVVA